MFNEKFRWQLKHFLFMFIFFAVFLIGDGGRENGAGGYKKATV